ncbi:MAG: DUF4340 domain-containing protein [bacterium]
MKGKQLVILTGVAAALAGLAVWSTRNESQHTSASGLGGKILPALKDQINNVTSLAIQSTASTVTVTRVDGIWRVPAKWNYPADFGTIREALNSLADLKALHFIRTTPSERAQLQLLTAADKGSTNLDQCATQVTIQGTGNKSLALLHLGKTRSRPGQTDDAAMGGGYPDGRYVMNEKGQVWLTGETLQNLTPPLQNWLDPEFLNLTDILSVQITHPSQDSIKAERANPNGEFTLQGAIPAEKIVDQAKLNQIGSTLGSLRYDDIADPKLAPETTGLDKPVVCQIRTRKGESVTIRIGKSPVGETKRYATVSVAFEAPVQAPVSGTNQEVAVKAQAEEQAKTASAAKTLHEKLSPWIYLISQECASALSPERNALMQDKPKPGDTKDEKKP